MEGGRLIEGGRLLPFPVGNQAYLSSITQFTHRVIVAIETGFPCIPYRTTIENDGGGEGALVYILALGGGPLFKEIR